VLRDTLHWLHRPSSGASPSSWLLLLFLSGFLVTVGLEGVSVWGYHIFFCVI
jgi:hypothetical protein